MIRTFLLGVLFATLAACGGGEVGEACESNDACESGQCILGGSFPGGTCTPSCSANADCPEGFRCISRSSGICLPACGSSDECEDLRGPDWQCRDESLQGDGGGNAMVCIGD
jgi:hypothetical protein